MQSKESKINLTYGAKIPSV